MEKYQVGGYKASIDRNEKESTWNGNVMVAFIEACLMPSLHAKATSSPVNVFALIFLLKWK